MISLRLGDCLDVMAGIPDGSIDLILADLPYGTTACKWDVIIPFEPLWAHYRRLLKSRGAVVLTASQPFTSMLVTSNPKWFKYCWVWEKNSPSGHLNAKHRPMMATEDVAVFYGRMTTYNPQPAPSNIRDRPTGKANGTRRDRGVNSRSPYRSHATAHVGEVAILKPMVSPRNLIRFDVVPRATGTLHPTQKPVALMEYLVRTYTNEGDTVLDNTMGSGTTGEACINTGRNFIGIEKDPAYFAVAERRIAAAQPVVA